LSSVSESMGNAAEAEAQAQHALALLQAFGDRGDRSARAFLALGQALASQGRYTDARSHYAAALVISREAGDGWFTAMSLSAVAEVASALGFPLQAVRLLAAQSALLARSGAPLPPSMWQQIERCQLAIHRVINAEEYGMAWAAGEALSLDDAIEEAMALRAAPTTRA